MKKQLATRGGLRQHRRTPRLETFEASVVTDPRLEQVTEDEDRVGGSVQQVVAPRFETERRVVREVEVTDEIDATPPGLRHDLARCAQWLHHVRVRRRAPP